MPKVNSQGLAKVNSAILLLSLSLLSQEGCEALENSFRLMLKLMKNWAQLVDIYIGVELGDIYFRFYVASYMHACINVEVYTSVIRGMHWIAILINQLNVRSLN